jgi:hypothetical protein
MIQKKNYWKGYTVIYAYRIFDETARRLKSIQASVILIGQRISFFLNGIFGNVKFNARLFTLILISIFGDYKLIK